MKKYETVSDNPLKRILKTELHLKSRQDIILNC